MIHHNLSNPFQHDVSQRFEEVFALTKDTDFFLELMLKQSNKSDFLENFFSELDKIHQDKEDYNEKCVESEPNSTIKDQLFLSERVQATYERLLRKSTLPVRAKQRIEILLQSLDQEDSITSIANKLNTTRKTVRKWIKQFVDYAVYFELPCVRALKAGPFSKFVLFIIRDAPRSGRKPNISAETILQIFLIACEDPINSNRPISQWSAREIADELIKRKIVTSISERSIKRFLQQAELKPHLSRYWCNSPEKNNPDFDERVRKVCDLYLNAFAYAKQNIRIISMDEKTGIQALERASPTIRMKPGRPEQREHNYNRHGTRCLIAGLEVGTGKIIQPYINETRKEEDWVEAIKMIVATDQPQKFFLFVNSPKKKKQHL